MMKAKQASTRSRRRRTNTILRPAPRLDEPKLCTDLRERAATITALVDLRA
jgi:hypothetical protein